MSLRIVAILTATAAIVSPAGETLLPEGGQLEIDLPPHLEEAQARQIAANLHSGALAPHCAVRDGDRDRVQLVAIRPCDCFGVAITRAEWKDRKANAAGRIEVPVLRFALPGSHKQRLQLAELLRTGAIANKLSLAVRLIDPEAEAAAKAEAAKRQAEEAKRAEAEAKRLAEEEAKRLAAQGQGGGQQPPAGKPNAGGQLPKDPLTP